MVTAVVFIAAAAAVGAFAWNGEVLLLPVACLFPALWAFAPTRLVAGLVSMAYFMAASRGLPIGVSIFYATDLWLGFVLWVAASLSFVVVHTALWSAQSGWRKAVRYAIAAILMSVPPFGIVGWASPVTAAGVLFPGWGWAGLLTTATGLLVATTRFWPIAALTLGGAYMWSAAVWTPPTVPNGWLGINTEFGLPHAGRYAAYEQQLETITKAQRGAREGYPVIVLPESALGNWTPMAEHLWARGLEGFEASVLAGAIIVTKDGYDNVIVEVTGIGSKTLYQERMPVPLSMWQPWAAGGVKARFFANPVIDVGGLRIVPLICYEQLLIWPILQSMMGGPDAIVAIGNGWWTSGTMIVAVQETSTTAWASLFGVSLVVAFNN